MRITAVVIALVVVSTLAGCMMFPVTQSEGVLSITIQRRPAYSAGITPKLIPEIAEKIRIRIWNPNTGFSTVATASMDDHQLSVVVPEGHGYNVDAVSYYMIDNRALALTGGSAANVSVEATETTSVQIGLRPWHTEVGGDEDVESGKSYAVELVATDGGGIITREAFEAASLHTSTESFQDPEAPLPDTPGTYGIVQDDRISFVATAPNLTEAAPVFIGALVLFTRGWTDTSLLNADEQPLYLELANRHTGESICQILVTASASNIVIGISSESE